jgi:hypothetical protein
MRCDATTSAEGSQCLTSPPCTRALHVHVPIRAAPPLSRVLTSSGLREYLTCGYTLLGRCCAAQSLDLGLGVDRSESDVSAHALLGFDPLTMPRDTNRGDTGRRVDGRSWRRGRTTPRRPTISRAAASAAPRSVRSAAVCVCLLASAIAADTATRACADGCGAEVGGAGGAARPPDRTQSA